MSALTDQLNALNRLSKEDRDAAILRSAFGPLYDQFFGVADLREERVRREREAAERRHAARHAEPGDAA